MTCYRSIVVVFVDLTFLCLWDSFSIGTLVICRRKNFFTKWISIFQDQTSSLYITDGTHLHQNQTRWSWLVSTYLSLIPNQIWNQKMSKTESKHNMELPFILDALFKGNCCWKKIADDKIIVGGGGEEGVGGLVRGEGLRYDDGWDNKPFILPPFLPLENNLSPPSPPNYQMMVIKCDFF